MMQQPAFEDDIITLDAADFQYQYLMSNVAYKVEVGLRASRHNAVEDENGVEGLRGVKQFLHKGRVGDVPLQALDII